MSDRVRALLREAPGLEVASRIAPPRLEVPEAFASILPFAGLRLGTTVGITGVCATSLALALISRASTERWTAVVGLSAINLAAAAELGVDLDRLVVVPDPADRTTHTLAAVIDAFDVVLAGSGSHGAHRKIQARVREQDAVLVAVGGWPGSDLSIHCVSASWRGLGEGHGHLQTRTIDVIVDGRGAAARGARTTLVLPDDDGGVSLASDHRVVALHGGAQRSRNW